MADVVYICPRQTQREFADSWLTPSKLGDSEMNNIPIDELFHSLAENQANAGSA
ncbi:hypothetical protein [Novipirellula rosea]|uniref:Uncharacterized protein n=1 Tax=Novipirellula rosea TaxID=1031540 RepID=A0ABP8MRC4_9BACT